MSTMITVVRESYKFTCDFTCESWSHRPQGTLKLLSVHENYDQLVWRRNDLKFKNEPIFRNRAKVTNEQHDQFSEWPELRVHMQENNDQYIFEKVFKLSVFQKCMRIMISMVEKPFYEEVNTNNEHHDHWSQ